MNTTTTRSTRPWAPTPSTSTPRRAGLWFAGLTSLALFVPGESAAVSLTPTVNEPECVVLSGSWVGGFFTDPVYFVDNYEGDGGIFLFNFILVGSSDGFGVVLLRDFTTRNDMMGHSFHPGSVGGFFREQLFESGRTVSMTSSFSENVGWSGTYKVTEGICVPSPVPDAGGTLALFACGIGAVGAGRRFLIQRRA